MPKENLYFHLKPSVVTPKILLSNLGGLLLICFKETTKHWESNIMAMEK